MNERRKESERRGGSALQLAERDDMLSGMTKRISEMAEAGDIVQDLMSQAHVKFRVHAENGGEWKARFSDPSVTGAEKAAVILGNFHYQVENGGPSQWWDNRYAHATGANGRTAAESVVGLIRAYGHVDEEVADVFAAIAGHVASLPSPDKPVRFIEDEDDDEAFAWGDIEEASKAFGEFTQERRMSFLDAVVSAHDPNEDPFRMATPALPLPSVSRRDVRVRLVGEDGNAFSMIARTRVAMRRAGLSHEAIERFTEEAKSGDYDNVVSTIRKYATTEETSDFHP